MKHTKNQTNDTTANQSPKMSNYLLVKIALAGIISSLLPVSYTHLEETHASTIAVMPVPHEDVSSYGVIAPQGKGENGRYSVETFVEKPNPCLLYTSLLRLLRQNATYAMFL